jgi:predicted DNA-binding transcriptional regulator
VLGGQRLELAAGTMKLQGKPPAEVGVLDQAGLLEQPLGDGGWIGQVWAMGVPLHLLQGAQGVGQQAQVVPLERR